MSPFLIFGESPSTRSPIKTRFVFHRLCIGERRNDGESINEYTGFKHFHRLLHSVQFHECISNPLVSPRPIVFQCDAFLTVGKCLCKPSQINVAGTSIPPKGMGISLMAFVYSLSAFLYLFLRNKSFPLFLAALAFFLVVIATRMRSEYLLAANQRITIHSKSLISTCNIGDSASQYRLSGDSA